MTIDTACDTATAAAANTTTTLTEYKEKYTWKPIQHTSPPQSDDENMNIPRVAIDPNMYKTTTHDDYKPYARDAYRAPEPECADEQPERAPVDPNMYKTTTHDDYKPYARDAYRAPEPECADEQPERAPVDPNMYKTTTHDDYKPYAQGDSSAPVAARSLPDEVSTPVSQHAYGCARPTDAAAEQVAAVNTAPAAPSHKASRSGSFVTTKQLDCAPPPPHAYARNNADGTTASRAPSSSSVTAARVRHASPDHFVTTKMRDFAPVAPSRATSTSMSPAANGVGDCAASSSAQHAPPSRQPSSSRPRADRRDFATEYKRQFGKPAMPSLSSANTAATSRAAQACVHHVDAAFYTTTNRAAFLPHSVVPVRSTYTRPTISVRHVDPSMYVTSSRASYQ